MNCTWCLACMQTQKQILQVHTSMMDIVWKPIHINACHLFFHEVVVPPWLVLLVACQWKYKCLQIDN